MVLELIKYPDTYIRRISGNVRFFDDTLHTTVENMCDTMKFYGLSALSAIQVGIDLNIIVLEEQTEYKIYINSRILKHSDATIETERSLYYEGISVDIERYNKLTVIYEDIDGQANSCDFEYPIARIFQQQLDFCFGSTFVDRVDKETRQRILDYLASSVSKKDYSASCPTIFYRDYIKRAINYLLFAMAISFIIPFFVDKSAQKSVYSAESYLVWLIPILIIVYFIYSQYETKKYRQCTSCQIGNILGSIFVMLIQLVFILVGIFAWMKP